MSSTRTAKDDSFFHQERFASSPEFERGLLANRVVDRAALLDDKADRELIWFIQYLSHQPGGLKALVEDWISKFGDQLGTEAMVKIGKQAGQTYSADEVKQIRADLPFHARSQFPLKGELDSEVRKALRDEHGLARARQLREIAEDAFECLSLKEDGELEAMQAQAHEEAERHPVSYPVNDFNDACFASALTDSVERESRADNLQNVLRNMCLNPAAGLHSNPPWYFYKLTESLKQYQAHWIAEKSKVVTTRLGAKVHGVLDYAFHSRSLALMEGNARMGKSFAARVWCEQRPGASRFIQIPPGNDDATFFRTIARGLGLGKLTQYKVAEIRDRVESVLLTGDLLLVLDEAQRLWPQRTFRPGHPSRIVWVMTMADAGVPICMVATPQFIETQKAVERNGWNSAQFTGRLGHYEFLPTELDIADLEAVGRAVLPEASADVLKALAIYARTSDRYLAAVDSIGKRAKYIAQRAGRDTCQTEDVRLAMKESVVPSDTMLARTLANNRKPSTRMKPLPPPSAEFNPETPAPRGIAAASMPMETNSRRSGTASELIKA